VKILRPGLSSVVIIIMIKHFLGSNFMAKHGPAFIAFGYEMWIKCFFHR